MRPSKQRSRSKSNRQRPLGNIVNRVFDSSGPDGKVRGTPQQIIEKYLVLARDAQLGNDRVAAENFLQHAEHYTRMLTEAQREAQAEADARRQQHEAQQRESHPRESQQRERHQPGRQTYDPVAEGNAAERAMAAEQRSELRASPEALSDPVGESDTDEAGSTLVETPESGLHAGDAPASRAAADAKPEDAAPPAATAEEKPRARNTRKARAKPEAPGSKSVSAPEGEANETASADTEAGAKPDTAATGSGADEPAPARKRAVRKPRATRSNAKSGTSEQQPAGASPESGATQAADAPKSAAG